MLRRTDLPIAEKRERMTKLLGKYSFRDCLTR
jgi:hypothetical protein